MVLDRKNIKVGNFIELYLQDYIIPKIRHEIGNQTYTTVKRKLKVITSNIGKMALKFVTPKTVQEIQNKLLLTYSPRYACSVMDDFRRVLKIAQRWRYISENPAKDIERSKVKTKKPDILSQSQINALLNTSNVQGKAIIGLAALAGLRRSEIFGLMWIDISFDDKTIRIERQYCDGTLIPTTKTEKSTRMVPILPVP